jgi:acyl dehydratase
MSSSSFTVPVERRYFEDYLVGSVHEFGSIAVEEDEIIAFAKRFDPQIFHTDPESAKRTIFGGLIASGWHTAGLMMRLFANNFLSKVASLGSPGVDELHWNRPVRPGDELSIRVTVLEKRRSRTKPDRGVVHSFIEVMNQNREVVMSMKAVNIFFCRERPQTQ